MITDERLTAYALNETDAAESAAIEAHLAANPDARAHVDALRALGRNLSTLLAAEAKPILPAKPTPKWRSSTIVALAASVLLAIGVGVASRIPRVETVAVNHGAKLPPTPTPTTAEPERLRKELADEVAPRDAAAAAEPAKQFDKSARGMPAPLPPPGMPNAPVVSGAVLAKKAAELPEVQVPADAKNMAGGKLEEKAKADGIANGKDGKPGAPLDGAKPASTTGDHREPFFGQRVQPAEGGSLNLFPLLPENDFVKVEGTAALSTFGVDVDTASYSIVRTYLRNNSMPPPGAVRLEELVNYFPYRDPPPSDGEPFAVTTEVAECPWQPKHRLARIALKAKPIDFKTRPSTNLVFLIDVSGSMDEPNKLPLVIKSLKLLVDQLGENDKVAIVVYAGSSGLVLDSTNATNKPAILGALDRLKAGGSTNGAQGIELAYSVAEAHRIEGGVNRVILCTDGDWNVGITDTGDLVKLIEAKRKTNVFLSVCGFGIGNLRDEMMVNLANKGNGQHYYIDGIKEARKAFVESIGGTLVTVAKDVKVQIEFNPATVGSYRLLGYEKRLLAAADFANDAKDAGEIGAGHVVTALYELTPAGQSSVAGAGQLRYQKADAQKMHPDEAFQVRLRHKPPTGDVSTLKEFSVKYRTAKDASEDFRFAAAVASFAMLLRDSPHKGVATYAMVDELAKHAMSWDPGGYRAEFVKLVGKAKQVSGKP